MNRAVPVRRAIARAERYRSAGAPERIVAYAREHQGPLPMLATAIRSGAEPALTEGELYWSRAFYAAWGATDAVVHPEFRPIMAGLTGNR